MAKRRTVYECEECGDQLEMPELADRCAADDRARREQERLLKRFRSICDEIDWRLTVGFVDEFEALVRRHVAEGRAHG